jgi:hypothetical protein
MNSYSSFNTKTNIYDEVEARLDINIPKEELPKKSFSNNRIVSLVDQTNSYNDNDSSMEHIYEEVNYKNEEKSSKSLLKKKKKNF